MNDDSRSLTSEKINLMWILTLVLFARTTSDTNFLQRTIRRARVHREGIASREALEFDRWFRDNSKTHIRWREHIYTRAHARTHTHTHKSTGKKCQIKFIARERATQRCIFRAAWRACDERLIELFPNKHCIRIDVGNQYDIRARVSVSPLPPLVRVCPETKKQQIKKEESRV